MPTEQSKVSKAALQALFVTFLWSTSWVLIKESLDSLPPVTFGGLRYTLAFVILLPLLWPQLRRGELGQLTRRDWGLLLLLGLIYYTITQGAQFVGLQYLDASTFSLMLAFTGVTISLAAWPLLGERLTAWQWSGVVISILGALIYFGNVGAISTEGMLVGIGAVTANTVSALLGRAVNRRASISPLMVTVVSMGLGGGGLLAIGLLTEPLPALTLNDIAVITWLAAVSTALAFTLWNLTLQTLTAAQSGMINNTMLIQIAVLAWIFLGERPGPVQIVGLLITAAGTVMVQVRPRQATKPIMEEGPA